MDFFAGAHPVGFSLEALYQKTGTRPKKPVWQPIPWGGVHQSSSRICSVSWWKHHRGFPTNGHPMFMGPSKTISIRSVLIRASGERSHTWRGIDFVKLLEAMNFLLLQTLSGADVQVINKLLGVGRATTSYGLGSEVLFRFFIAQGYVFPVFLCFGCVCCVF